MMTPEEIADEELVNVIPKRRGARLQRKTVNYLRHKKNTNKWLAARRPGIRQKTRMLTMAVCYGVQTAMSCHTCKVADDIIVS
jgi:hypothetical protein